MGDSRNAAPYAGTNACVNAPSAVNRRKVLGSRNAAKKASITAPAPKTAARTTSRTSPKTRDANVQPLTVQKARSIFTVNVFACG
ncbi:MAG: hypothetical protein HAW59_03565 [Betaproteobacteria bacterium]|nr:hypothetical protein [Betaproteobacteria bacterium]